MLIVHVRSRSGHDTIPLSQFERPAPDMNVHQSEPDAEPYSTLKLPDGRTLGYLQVGAPDGPAVFHFHGHGSSRLEALMLADEATAHGIRVIALDRPGIGRSDPKLGDRLLDWPADVAAAADALNIDQFAVQGMSAGGPYALACAHSMPERVTACALVSAVPPPEIARRTGPRIRRLVWWAANRFPNYLRRRLKEFRPDGPPDEEMVQNRMARVSQWLGGEDERLMHIPQLRAVLARTMMETARQGASANNDEIARLVRPWGFDVRKIALERIFIWHGEEDRIMPIEPARRLARILTTSRSVFYPGEGHFSVLVNRAGELLRALVPDSR
jgi:pimeloyl-ACP methyl ester carboxylesterase